MTAFPWDPGLETGHDEIDDQHRSLFALASRLQEALDACPSGDEALVGDAVYALTDYVVQHFGDEQDLMEAAGYPRAALHKDLHDHLTGETMRYAARFMNGEDVELSALAPFVTDWLRSHIRNEDQRMVRFLKEGSL